jgi:hypothetical protein
VKEFRKWFLENIDLLKTDEVETFIFKMQAKFLITREINPNSIDYSNSGSEEIINYSVQEIENQIDDILRAAGRFFCDNPALQNVIRRFQKLTFLAYVEGNIYTNDSGLNDKELKDFLRMYDAKFKKPVKELLLHYYRLLFNPDMTFSDTLLDKMGFRPCGNCCGIHNSLKD